MSTIRIIVDDINNGKRRTFTVQKNLSASQLVPALASQFNLPLQTGNAIHSYKLVRNHNGHVLRDADTFSTIDAEENEVFVLLTEEQILEYIKESQEGQLLRIPSKWEILFGLAAGIFFIAFNFPMGMISLGYTLGWPLVGDVGSAAASILNDLFGASYTMQTVSFNNLWLGLVVALSAYLVVLASLSLRHQRFDLFALGFLWLVIGTASLHLIVWLVYLIRWLIYFIFVILAWIFQGLGFILAIIGKGLEFLFAIIGNALGFLFRHGWWFLALFLLLGGIYLAVKYRTKFLKAILWILAVSGITYLLVKLFQFLLPYIQQILMAIGQFLAPVFAFLGSILEWIFQILGYLLIILFAGFVIYAPGSLLLDQFRGAWTAGHGRRGVTLGALSIGTSLAFVLLESNLGNVVRFYPGEFQQFVMNYFYQANPIFSVVITLLVVGVSIVGLLRNFSQLHRGPSLRQFQMAMAITMPLAVLATIVMVAISHHTESN